MSDAWALLEIANEEIANLKDEIEERDRDYEKICSQLAKANDESNAVRREMLKLRIKAAVVDKYKEEDTRLRAENAGLESQVIALACEEVGPLRAELAEARSALAEVASGVTDALGHVAAVAEEGEGDGNDHL